MSREIMVHNYHRILNLTQTQCFMHVPLSCTNFLETPLRIKLFFPIFSSILCKQVTPNFHFYPKCSINNEEKIFYIC